jgi:hypothetical protein
VPPTRARTRAYDVRARSKTYYYNYLHLGWRFVLNSNAGRDMPSGGASAGVKDLVTYFVDRSREVNGLTPPKRVTGALAKELAALAKEGHSSDLLLTGIDILIEKGLDAKSIPSAVFTAQARMRDGMSRADLQLLNGFLDEIRAERGIRWPTGSREVRSMLANNYVEDPLGLDEPPYRVPWSRPSKRAIVEALRERSTHEPDPRTTADHPTGAAKGP